ncbi:Uncharacterised protein [Leclercia adecarboxylata]|uniref:Uncharacterized protein n=1 Tax=Leclercia adecarboxylata TaxID=83655 RepID=A0A4U9IS74_9ENTR|nr:Uncharacterised protein [Leclercia adecarboxylata]
MWQRSKTLILVLGLLMSYQALAGSAWDSYKARFLMADGRIIDTGKQQCEPH